MHITASWRFPVLAILGAAMYVALLYVCYGLLQGYYVPQHWLLQDAVSRSIVTACWFVFLNATGAILAAIPVALAMRLLVKTHRLPVALLLGFLASGYFVGSALREYGLPSYVAAWVVDVLQFASIALAVGLLVRLSDRSRT